MRLIHCACGWGPSIAGAEELLLDAVPSRAQLAPLDHAARECLPEDPTPSLAEIQASPDVAHLGEPAFAPQQPSEPLRVIVSGTDASLGAVLTRLMRADTMWVEVAYIPQDPTSPAARLWNVPQATAEAAAFAAEAPIAPASCLRNDSGQVVAGSAEIRLDVGEIVVDSEQLYFSTGGRQSRLTGQFGARLTPMVGAPGVEVTSISGALRRARSLTGRAVQAGGESIHLLIDAHPHPRTVTHTTFYRHLRDIQAVRNP